MTDMIDTIDTTDTGERMQRLKAAMRELPQASVETSHFFVPGMYCRVLARAKDTVIVGKKHRASHFYIVCKGSVAVVNADGSRRVLKAGDVLVSQPGTQRAVVALEDTICLTVHRTDHVDLDDIEAELIEPDGLALFDARNQLKDAAAPALIGGAA